MLYKKSFEALWEELKSEGNTEHVVEVKPRNDRDNKYSDSGKAVAVYIRKKSRTRLRIATSRVFDQLESEDGAGTLGARLRLDCFDAKPQKKARAALDLRAVNV